MLPRWRSRVSLDADLAEVDGNRRYFFRTDNPFPISFPVCLTFDLLLLLLLLLLARRRSPLTGHFKKSRETFAREFANFRDSRHSLHGMTGRELFAWPLAKAPRHLYTLYTRGSRLIGAIRGKSGRNIYRWHESIGFRSWFSRPRVERNEPTFHTFYTRYEWKTCA